MTTRIDLGSRVLPGTSLDKMTENEQQLAIRSAAHNADRNFIYHLTRGINLDFKDDDGLSPVFLATERDHEDIVTLLLGKGADPNSTNKHGQSPLFLTMQRNNQHLASILLEEGADPNLQDNDKKSPLHLATELGHVHLVNVLLANGANPNLDDAEGRTSLSLAAERCLMSLVGVLVSNDLVEKNSKDQNGWTPLSWAAACGHTELVSMMLDIKSINPHSQDNSGRTPLSLAAERGHHKIVEILCKHSDPNTRDNLGYTLLWWAAIHKHKKVAWELVTRDKVTMHLLAQNGVEKLLDLLLGWGYSVDSCDSSGLSLLRIAIRQKNQGLIKLLLRYSARTEGVSKRNWLDAFSRRAASVVQILEAEDGTLEVNFDPNELMPRPTHAKRQLCLFVNYFWRDVPFYWSEDKLLLSHLHISQQDHTDNSVRFSIAMFFSSEDDAMMGRFGMHEWGEIRIAWTIKPGTLLGSDIWESVDYYSKLPYGWIPKDWFDFLKQFLLYLEERWLKLCDLGEEHLDELRLDQLGSEGKGPEIMCHIAREAKRWTGLRRTLQAQIRDIRNFIWYYCQDYDMDQSVKELLQIEFDWAAITGSRISTRLGQDVMLLTYVSIFYLPLGFCAALWAIPNLSDHGTKISFVITSAIVGLITLLVAFNLENIAGLAGKMYHIWRAKVIRDMAGDERWKESGERLQEADITRARPSEWLLVGYVMYRLMKAMRMPAKDLSERGDMESTGTGTCPGGM